MRVLCALLILFLISCQQPTDNKNKLDKSENWTVHGDANWIFNESEIISELDSGSAFIATKLQFQNFKLELEFFPDSTINSGIYLRCTNKALSAEDCYELNIWDLHPNQQWRTGAVVLNQSPITEVQTINHWNRCKIECFDNTLKAWINDQLVADLTDANSKPGYLALQAAGTGKIMFRNIQLEEL